MKNVRTRLLALTATAGLALSLGSVTASAAPTPAAPTKATTTTSTTTSTEDAKLDKVATPRLGWFSCYGGAECATVKLPLDYDNPKGAKTNVAVLRQKATGKRIGTLFVNPGGPGGSSTEMAYAAGQWLSPEVREKFDVVGVDPRGIGFSDQVQCLPVERQDEVMKDLRVAFPVGTTEQRRFITATEKVTRACSKNSLATSMSTAEVARDMEMVRRALGSDKLSYIGFSYGSHLGTTYANMFPKNFRSLVIDGVLSPTAWSGTRSTQSSPLEERLRSGRGASKALDKILRECGKVGPSRCGYAEGGDPRAKFAALTAELKKKPVEVTDPFEGGTFTLTYADVIGTLLGTLYDPEAPSMVDFTLTDIESMIEASEAPQSRTATSQRTTLHREVVAELKKDRTAPRRGFVYDNSLDAFLSVTCTDSRETTRIDDFPAYATKSDAAAPHFGPAWLWSSAGCAGDAFTGQDEDAYVGPYNRVTPKGVLVVGNYWDPATNYDGAVRTRSILGRSRLISSDSWGHTAYGVSACVTQRVDSYLLRGISPRIDATCPAETEMFPDWGAQSAPESVPQLLERTSLPKGKGKGFPAPTVVR
ncbi:hypothetical protein ASJ30_01085 [Janibacter indicus]|uniref:TAP-like protein n=1 Tax=Janibacter indicus TaxID=857417 RepID=A0A1L3MD70_9MICO|nr:alpha/beta hydrolase [Janibacter indicus]APH00297.1 hypothetical protein ASJ30_01085 [Janibacter indicus]